jgi:hypothetical protein
MSWSRLWHFMKMHVQIMYVWLWTRERLKLCLWNSLWTMFLWNYPTAPWHDMIMMMTGTRIHDMLQVWFTDSTAHHTSQCGLSVGWPSPECTPMVTIFCSTMVHRPRKISLQAALLWPQDWAHEVFRDTLTYVAQGSKMRKMTQGVIKFQ